jgi:hypothetical protein
VVDLEYLLNFLVELISEYLALLLLCDVVEVLGRGDELTVVQVLALNV